MNENKRSIYDIDPIMGESLVAKAVREANQLPDNERLKALSKLAKTLTEEKKPLVKIKLNPDKKIGVKITDIGAGGKEYVRKNTIDEVK